MIKILNLFLLKILDCTFGTFKTMFLLKNKYFYSALVFSISSYFYLTMMVSLAKNSSELYKVMICLATFVGTYFPSKFFHKYDTRKDKLYIFDITARDMETGKAFADNMRETDIAIKTEKARDTDMNRVLSITIYCDTKIESKMVKQLIPKEFKYNVYAPIETDDY